MIDAIKLSVAETETDVDREAALRVSRQVLLKPDSLIGLATGDTTVGMYHWMVRLHKELAIDYSGVKTCNLDEYVGVAESDKSSCRYRIHKDLLSHINIKPENTYVPNGLCEPPEQELQTFRETVERFGGVDLQIVGVGSNGHIAFNEPGTPFNSTYHIVPIAQSTIEAKSKMFGGRDKVPTHGISMGIRDIMSSRKILLIAKGAHKAPIIEKIINGDICMDVPASVLRLHPDVEIVIDRSAASLL